MRPCSNVIKVSTDITRQREDRTNDVPAIRRINERIMLEKQVNSDLMIDFESQFESKYYDSPMLLPFPLLPNIPFPNSVFWYFLIPFPNILTNVTLLSRLEETIVQCLYVGHVACLYGNGSADVIKWLYKPPTACGDKHTEPVEFKVVLSVRLT